MAKIIQNYFASTILRTTAMVLLVFVSVLLLISFLEELRHLGKGDYNLLIMMVVVVLKLPALIYQLFPMAALLGSLMGLGLLAAHCELVAMRAAGFSIANMLLALLKAAIVMLLFVTLLGEGIAPISASLAERYKTTALSSGQTLKTDQGIWLRTGNVFLHVMRALDSGHMQDVTMYEFNDKRKLVTTLHAKEAIYVNRQWQLNDVDETQIRENSTQSKHYEKRNSSLQITPKFFNYIDVKPQAMTLSELHHYIQYRQKNHLLADNFKLMFWQRILQPLATLIMVLLAMPFILGPLRSTSTGLRLFTGICLGFGFFITNQFLGPLSLVYQLPPLLAASLPILIFAGLGAGLLYWRRYA